MFDVGGVGGTVGETEGGAVRFAGALSRKDRVWIDSFHRGYKERLRRSKEEAVRRRGEKEGERERGGIERNLVVFSRRRKRSAKRRGGKKKKGKKLERKIR